MSKTGRFYGIGLGPGDPELITVKARRLLRQCSVLCVPQGSNKAEGLAFSLLKSFPQGKNQEVIPMIFPMTTDPQALAAAWDQGATIIAQKLKEGRDVAFLTEGDPLLYSTFIYVYQSLKKAYPEARVEIIPGVSSIMAAAARAQVPLATGNETLAIMPALDNEKYLKETLEAFDSVVFLKVNRSFDKLLALVEEKGLTDKAVLVTRCFLPGEKVVRNIRELKGKKLDYFTLLIVKKN